MVEAGLGVLGRLAWWQARAFTRDVRWPVLAAGCAWMNFAVDGLIRWGSASIWHDGDAVVSATRRRPRLWRGLGLMLGVVVVCVGVVAAAWSPVGSAIVGIILGVGMFWAIAGLVVVLVAVPARRQTGAARRLLRREHGGSVELINVARAPQGRGGAARELMGQVAGKLTAEGAVVVCIARSAWHRDYYTVAGWETVGGFLCRRSVPVGDHRDRRR